MLYLRDMCICGFLRNRSWSFAGGLAALVIAVLAALFPASERCFARQDDYREEPQFLQRQQALEAKRAEALRQMQKLGEARTTNPAADGGVADVAL